MLKSRITGTAMTPASLETANEPLLKVEKLSVSRSGRSIIEDVCLTIDEGEFVGLVGPNGGGKTTFLLTILGLSLIHI